MGLFACYYSVAILPGTEEQLREWAKACEEEFIVDKNVDENSERARI